MRTTHLASEDQHLDLLVPWLEGDWAEDWHWSKGGGRPPLTSNMRLQMKLDLQLWYWRWNKVQTFCQVPRDNINFSALCLKVLKCKINSNFQMATPLKALRVRGSQKRWDHHLGKLFFLDSSLVFTKDKSIQLLGNRCPSQRYISY